MIPYFLIFFLSAGFAIGSPPNAPWRGAGHVYFVLYATLIALMIGFRWEVGGDWGWDARRMLQWRGADFAYYVQKGDPGYMALMWLGVQSGFNIWFTHLIGGAIFAFGLWRFCLRQVHPWLSMTVAIPYLVIVVAMGYDRQAVAIGLVMLAMVALQNRSLRGFVGSMMLAATVHLTALTLLPVFVFASRISKLRAIVIGGPMFAAGYFYALQEKSDTWVAGYIGTGYSSSGAAIRVAMNALPAVLYFVFRSRFRLDDDGRRFVDVIALVALLFVGMLVVSPSSTAVDRMALYIIPIQLLVLGRLPFALATTNKNYQLLVGGVVAYSAAVMVVWLNYSENWRWWVPYSLIDADDLIGLSY
jgi:hypothetical protein